MTYSIKEIFLSLQGEGIQSGKISLFCRFSGCNLWNGLEKDREKSICKFCDTDFIGTNGAYGGKYASPENLAETIADIWEKETKSSAEKHVIFTGGEPLLQLDAPLLSALKDHGFKISLETNGSLMPSKDVLTLLDWICVSPKEEKLALTAGDELKFIYPQTHLTPESFQHLKFKHFILQPMDNENKKENTKQALNYCLTHPNWRLGLQLHKILDIE
ncbi:7-carboxy-7-deazaguanine synthase [Acetobacteraceae bacterium]|nr:7-carboxy-7-deazaguanine synthase [Acetobacteraceae bacterium]